MFCSILLASTSRALFVETHFHLLQHFRCITNDQFDGANGLLEQFNCLFVIFSLDGLKCGKMLLNWPISNVHK